MFVLVDLIGNINYLMKKMSSKPFYKHLIFTHPAYYITGYWAMMNAPIPHVQTIQWFTKLPKLNLVNCNFLMPYICFAGSKKIYLDAALLHISFNWKWQLLPNIMSLAAPIYGIKYKYAFFHGKSQLYWISRYLTKFRVQFGFFLFLFLLFFCCFCKVRRTN